MNKQTKIKTTYFSKFSGSESQWGKGKWHDHDLPSWKLKEELKNTFRCNGDSDEASATNDSTDPANRAQASEDIIEGIPLRPTSYLNADA